MRLFQHRKPLPNVPCILFVLLFFITSCQKAPEAYHVPATNATPTSVTAQPTTAKIAETPRMGKTDQPILLNPTPSLANTLKEKMLVIGDRGIVVLNPDGTDAISISEPMAREDSDPFLSPDGSKIVFGGKDGEIYVRSIDKNDLTNLTNFSGQDRHPVWSPDGTKIAFESARQEHFGIFIMNPDGSNVQNIVTMPNDVQLGGWSPDSRYIVFSNLAVPKDGVTEGIAYAPVYSLHIVDVITGSTRTLLDESNSGISNLIAPVFSPDGKRVAFQGIVQKQIAVYLIDVNGANLRKLTKGEDNYSNPAWSPDGSRIAVYVSPPRSRASKPAYLAIYSLEGLLESRLMNLGGIVTSWIKY